MSHLLAPAEEDRLIQHMLMLASGDTEGVVAWLVSLGCPVVERSAHQVAVRGLTGIRVGITPVDPYNAMAQIGLALFGSFFTRTCDADFCRRLDAQWTTMREFWPAGDLSEFGGTLSAARPERGEQTA